MWEDGQVAAIVTEQGVTLPDWDVPQLRVDAVPDGPPMLDSAGGPTDAAYVIFTSGSTGRPKGIEVAQHKVLNVLMSMQQRPGLAE